MSITISAQQRADLAKEIIPSHQMVGFLNTRHVTHILMQEINSAERALSSKLRTTEYSDAFIGIIIKTFYLAPLVYFSPFLVLPCALFKHECLAFFGPITVAGVISGAIIESMLESLGIPGPEEKMLIPAIAFALPTAFGLAGLCIEPIYVLASNTLAKGGFAYTARKVRGLVDKLETFGALPLEGSSLSLFLSERGIPSTVAREVISGMNIRQLLELRKQYKTCSLNHPIQRIFTSKSLNIINTLQNINGLSNIEGAIHQLRRSMQDDPTIWEEMVKALNSEHFERVENLLIEIGEEILSSSDSQVKALIDKLRCTVCLPFSNKKEVRLCAVIPSSLSTIFFKSCREITVKYSHLAEYDFFKGALQGDFSESSQGKIELALTAEEEAAFKPLFSFLQTRRIDLNISLARSMFILSERLGITDSSTICYNYLVKNREKFEPMKSLSSLFFCRKSLDLLSFLFRYGQTPFLVKRTQNILLEDLKKAKMARNYSLLDTLLKLGFENNVDLDRPLSLFPTLRTWTRDSKLLDLIFKYDELHEIQARAKSFLLEEFAATNLHDASPKNDFTVLHRCSHIPPPTGYD